jgi:hypothetical protein
MRKMKLDMDGLAVESFEMTAGGADERGTVRGNAATLRLCSVASSCAGGDTCQLSCTGSCATGLNCQQVC